MVCEDKQAALDAAHEAYMTCLPNDGTRTNALLSSVAEIRAAYNAEADQLRWVSSFLNQQATASSDNIRALATDAQEKLQKEIEDLKSEIRKERRIFIDSGAQISPAVGGLYFTLVPDNQILIAFMSCLGALILFVSALVFLNMIPIMYFEAMTSMNRIAFIGATWLFVLIFTYVSIFTFT